MINIQNIDTDECFTADHHPSRIGKVGKNLARKLDFKSIKFLVSIKDIQKNFINNSVFGYGNMENNATYEPKIL